MFIIFTYFFYIFRARCVRDAQCIGLCVATSNRTTTKQCKAPLPDGKKHIIYIDEQLHYQLLNRLFKSLCFNIANEFKSCLFLIQLGSVCTGHYLDGHECFSSSFCDNLTTGQTPICKPKYDNGHFCKSEVQCKSYYCGKRKTAV